MKVTKFQPQGFDAVLRGLLSNDTTAVSSNTYAINGILVQGTAHGSNWHIVSSGSNTAGWVPNNSIAGTTIRNAAQSNYHLVAIGSNDAYWVSHASDSSSSVGQLLISDTPSTPLVFADLIQNEAQDDLLYAD